MLWKDGGGGCTQIDRDVGISLGLLRKGEVKSDMSPNQGRLVQLLAPMLGIRIRRIRMFLGLPDPDPSLFSHKCVQRTKKMPTI